MGEPAQAGGVGSQLPPAGARGDEPLGESAGGDSIRDARLVTGPGSVAAARVNDEGRIAMPESSRDPIDTIIELELTASE